MVMLCSNDVESVVISYLEPWCLVSFFMECGLDFGKKFVYDAKGCMLKCEEVNKIFEIFSGIILIGLSFYDEKGCEITVPLDRILCCEMKNWSYDCFDFVEREFGKMVNMIDLKLIDCDNCTELNNVWMNLHKLTIQKNEALSSPFLGEISKYKKLDTLRLLNFEFCRKDIIEMSKCNKLVKLEIDRLRGFYMYEFAKFKWNIDVLKLKHCDGTNLDILLSCPNVRYVKIVDWEKLIDISALVRCIKLEKVDIVRCSKLMDVSTILRKCVKLRHVRVKDCGKLENLNIVGNM